MSYAKKPESLLSKPGVIEPHLQEKEVQEHPCLFSYMEEQGLLLVGFSSGEVIVYKEGERREVLRWAEHRCVFKCRP